MQLLKIIPLAMGLAVVPTTAAQLPYTSDDPAPSRRDLAPQELPRHAPGESHGSQIRAMRPARLEHPDVAVPRPAQTGNSKPVASTDQSPGSTSSDPEAILLSPPEQVEQHGDSPQKQSLPTGSLATVMGSLAIVLGLFFLVAWISRRGMSPGQGILPGDAVQVLGHAPLSGRQHMHLLRIGTKLLLVSATQTGAQTLTEITDPDEVQHMMALCERRRPESATATFREVMTQLSAQSARKESLLGDRSVAAEVPRIPRVHDGASEETHA